MWCKSYKYVFPIDFEVKCDLDLFSCGCASVFTCVYENGCGAARFPADKPNLNKLSWCFGWRARDTDDEERERERRGLKGQTAALWPMPDASPDQTIQNYSKRVGEVRNVPQMEIRVPGVKLLTFLFSHVTDESASRKKAPGFGYSLIRFRPHSYVEINLILIGYVRLRLSCKRTDGIFFIIIIEKCTQNRHWKNNINNLKCSKGRHSCKLQVNNIQIFPCQCDSSVI